MRPWIIERQREERRQREWRPEPLRIRQPPREWIEEQERRRSDEAERNQPTRGVLIIEM